MSFHGNLDTHLPAGPGDIQAKILVCHGAVDPYVGPDEVRAFVDEIETLVTEHGVGFFILADEEPTINREKFIALCEELIDRDLDVHWGINTRVTDILRDEDVLPLYRKAGLIHISLGTEASAQLNLERFRKEYYERIDTEADEEARDRKSQA